MSGSPPRKKERSEATSSPRDIIQTRSRVRSSQLFSAVRDPTSLERRPRSIFSRAASAVARITGIRISNDPSRERETFGNAEELARRPELNHILVPEFINPLQPQAVPPSAPSSESEEFEDAEETVISTPGAWERYRQQQRTVDLKKF